MKSLNLLAAAALGAATVVAGTASAQTAQSAPVNTNTQLSISAEGTSTRTPDIATYTAGVTTQGATASEALAANTEQMNKVIAAIKRAGIAEKDVQTSNLSINPIYSQPKRLPDGSYEENTRRITGYQANNMVSVRQRKLADTGKVIDALVQAGANEVNGPSFSLDKPGAAQDEARLAAIKEATARADLYAKATGLRVIRIVSISESGGYAPQNIAFRRAESDGVMMASAPTPVQAGELELTSRVNVQFELGR